MLLYWVENGIIGFFNVLKIIKADAPSPEGISLTVNGRPASSLGKTGLVPFFIFHYGMFWVVHGVFVFVFFGFPGVMFGGSNPSSPTSGGIFSVNLGGVSLAAVTIFASHAVSFFLNFIGEREYLTVSAAEQMFEPYSRVIVLHLTIIGGGMLAELLGAPVAALVIMVLLKIAVDLWAHLREHRKARQRPVKTPEGA